MRYNRGTTAIEYVMLIALLTLLFLAAWSLPKTTADLMAESSDNMSAPGSVNKNQANDNSSGEGCNQGKGNGSEGCDPGNSNNNQESNDEGTYKRGS